MATLGRVMPRRSPVRTARPGLPVLLVTVLLTTVFAVAACSFGSPPAAQNGAPPTFATPSDAASAPPSAGDNDAAEADVLATDIPQPWGIAFLPDGSGVVTERKTGRIVRVGEPQTDNGLTVTPIATVPGVSAIGDGGLLGVAVSHRFTRDHTLYVFYSTRSDNRIGAVTVGKSGVRVLVKGIPRGSTDNGGALGFGPDGYLYAATGDAGRTTAGKAKGAATAKAPSQDSKSLAGKILRMTTNGKPARGAHSLVYAYGFHDVEGLTWDTGKHLYVVDAGRSADNLDVVAAGRNYGWPLAGTAHAPAGVPQPIQTWPLDASSCAGISTLDNAVALACPTGKRMWLLQVTAKADVFGAPAAVLVNSFGRLRGAAAAPDGSLWISTSNTDGHGTPRPHDDQILRVVLADAGAGVT